MLTSGFCCVDVKLFGPVQEYTAPLIAVADNASVVPEQTGLTPETTGNEGGVGSINNIGPAGGNEEHPLALIKVILSYVPAVKFEMVI